MNQLPQKTSVDRRIQRTKRLLANALIELIVEKGYDSVSIQGITERANVGRSTFYAHFESKEQLLLSGHSELMRHLLPEPLTADGQEVTSIDFAILYEHVAGHHQLGLAMLGKKGGELVINHFREAIALLLLRQLPAAPVDARTKLRVQGVAWGLVGLLVAWLEAGMPASAAEMASISRSFVQALA
jgi:AcrR family transcriptional regulator